jgi:hypothetical protein
MIKPTYTMAIESQLADSMWDSGDPTTPLWNYHGYIYVVYVDTSGHVIVERRKNGQTIESATLGPDYVVDQNAHGRFSMGIDKNGCRLSLGQPSADYRPKILAARQTLALHFIGRWVAGEGEGTGFRITSPFFMLIGITRSTLW